MAKKKAAAAAPAPPPEPEQPPVDPAVEAALVAEARERELWLVEEDLHLPAQGAKVGQVDLDLHLDSLLARGRRLLAELNRNRVVYALKQKELEAWYRAQQAPLEQRLRWVDGLVRTFGGLLEFTKTKSRSLPNGRVGKRATQPRIDITDEAAAVRWCEDHGLTVKKTPLKTPIADFIAEHGTEEVHDLAGFVAVPGDKEGELYWDVPERKLLREAPRKKLVRRTTAPAAKNRFLDED
jgi:hypothetical protein